MLWTDYRNVFSFEPGIYAQHVSPDGQAAPGWPAAGASLSTSEAGQIALSDGAGGAFLATGGWDWYHHVLIRHVGPYGPVPPWPADGVAIEILSGPEPASLEPATPSGIEGAGPGDIMPSIALDDGGGLLVSWTHVSRSAQCVHVMKLTAAGAFTTGWPWSGAIPWAGYEYQFQSSVCKDGSGGAFVVWQDETNGVMVDHVLGDGSIDARWPTGGLSVAAPASSSSAPGMVWDDLGGCFVAWQQLDGAGENHPAVQHLLADGSIAPGWNAHGQVLSTAPSEPGAFRTYQGYIFSYSSIVADGAGGALMAWSQGAPGRGQVLVQRVQPDGLIAPGWSDGGVAAAPSADEQGLPSLAPDGSGGAFLAWESLSAGGENKIYAQHLTADGGVPAGWGAAGFLMVSGAGVRQHAVVDADGSGGAVVAWEDTRDGATNIFMGRAHPAVAAVPRSIPSTQLTLEGIRPNPSVAGPLRVAFSLANSDPATLELVDVAGRRVTKAEVGELGPGAHVVSLGAQSLEAGIYFLWLRQAGRQLVARCAVIR